VTCQLAYGDTVRASPAIWRPHRHQHISERRLFVPSQKKRKKRRWRTATIWLRAGRAFVSTAGLRRSRLDGTPASQSSHGASIRRIAHFACDHGRASRISLWRSGLARDAVASGRLTEMRRTRVLFPGVRRAMARGHCQGSLASSCANDQESGYGVGEPEIVHGRASTCHPTTVSDAPATDSAPHQGHAPAAASSRPIHTHLGGLRKKRGSSLDLWRVGLCRPFRRLC